MSSAWLQRPGDKDWLSACDVAAGNGEQIDLFDFAALADQWRQQDGLPAPVAHWRLDETAGYVASEERGRCPGVLSGVAADNSHWVAGTRGNGLRFDGIDDSVEMTGLPPSAANQPRTIALWVKLSSAPTANETILTWGEPTPGKHWRLEVDANRRLRFSCATGYAVASRPVGDTQWHHIAVALDPLVTSRPRVSDIRLYVDARPQAVYDLNEQDVAAGTMEDLRLGASLRSRREQTLRRCP